MLAKKTIIDKINSKEAIIGVIGLGYVGLPLTLRFVEQGFQTRGFDIDQYKVSKVNMGESYISHINKSKITQAILTNRLKATVSFEEIQTVDVIIICVPTPLNKYREPDLSYVINTLNSIIPYLHVGQMISLESTTYPGTVEEEFLPRVANAGFNVGNDVFLVYSPEREDPGNESFCVSNIPKVVGGITQDCREVGIALYNHVSEKIVSVSSTRTAEFTKLLENIYRAVNIGLVNELKIVADSMKLDIWEIIEAASTKPFGFTPFYPGPGLGGHCIPIDPFYLTWKAREFGLHTRFIELAGEINRMMPEWIVIKIMGALNEHGKAMNGSKILVLGIAYKKNIDDMRESPSVEIMQLLLNKGAEVLYSDPYVPVFPRMRNYFFNLQSVTIHQEMLASVDAVVIATDHDAFDYQLIQKHSKLVIDTRGRFRNKFDNIVKC
ncbi:MAG: nucleotide sugar dehydrogenase [Ignavibacteriae bacterium]|nr:nucleotide sugar dehydrogenase [Ignavibacteriota bacterium]